MATKKVDYVIGEKGTSKVAGGLKKVDSSFAKAAKSAALYAAAYIGVRGIISVTKQAIVAFGIQEDAEKKLATALGGVNTSLLDQASALQQLTTFGDEAIIGVQASIAAFTDNTDAIKQATEATLDMAMATGMDLKSAGDLVAKSLGSSTNALSRYGIEVTGAVGSTERLDTLVSNIADKFAGQASAAVETMTGQLQQASNATGDAAEAFGELLAPRLIELASLLKWGAEAVIEFIDSFKYQGSELTSVYDDLEDVTLKLSGNMTNLIAAEKLYGSNSFEANEQRKVYNRTLAEYSGIAKEITLLEQGLADAIHATTVEVEDLDVAYKNIIASQIVMFQALEKPQTWKEIRAEMAQTIDFSQLLAESLATAFDPDISAGDGIKGFVIQFMSLIEGAILASGALSSALTFAWVPGLGIGAAIAAIAALEVAKAGVRNVDFAATGADFVTSGPQLMMVGEAGREQVSVTPLEGPNINGPQGGMVLNFNAPVTDREFVRSFIIPEIQNAVRLNA